MKTNHFLLGLMAGFSLLACEPVSSEKEGFTTTYEAPFPNETVSEPTIFHPGTVSTLIDKFNTSFSPDGNTIYFTATSQKLGITGIAFQHFENGNFQQPEFVPFVSHDIPVADVHISPDGKRMLYATFKDYEGKPEGFNFNLWVSEFDGNQWQEPKPLGAPFQSQGNEFYPIMVDDGSIYFNSDRTGNSDLYCSRLVNGEYQEPQPLPSNINTPEREADAFFARDESYVIFVRVDAEDGFGNSDLYISFNNGDGSWTDPKNMGERVNSSGIDGSPYVTPDGKFLIFTTSRQAEGLKERAMANYDAFAEAATGPDNGSLNHYYFSFNPDDFRD